MAGSILLATDGSEDARRAAERAIDLAADRGATLHVLCVIDNRIVPEPGLSSAELATIAAEEYGHACVTGVRESAADRGVTVEGKYVHGVPHELIDAYAAEVDADLIVLGEHGDHRTHLGGVGRKLRSETAHEVLVVGTDS